MFNHEKNETNISHKLLACKISEEHFQRRYQSLSFSPKNTIDFVKKHILSVNQVPMYMFKTGGAGTGK